MGRVRSTHAREDKCISDFGGKARKKRLLERPGPRWENDIKIDLRETGWGSVDWIDLTQGKGQWTDLVMKIMKIQVP